MLHIFQSERDKKVLVALELLKHIDCDKCSQLVHENRLLQKQLEWLRTDIKRLERQR